ncbi:hypothetical protein [Microbacterium aerolatum]|uniref:DUF4232 domain-containing protein n=1 Tax=Microbacterium aerolatum TaxID=153731 RepID=A0A511ALF7_9MICO|nr:hypothetical protein [Microbacterium aerolatum]GEK86707.1 hypothetical protein MAE01_18830 [Microbacterium aerolatum]GGB19069.1 hypothetical protein GCM10007198_07010 [Microbacterium aerolatum]
MARPSKAVYRRRRLVFFTGLIVLLAAIGVGAWLLIAQPWAATAGQDAAPTSTATSTPATSPSPEETGEESPSPEPTTSAPAPCRAGDIVVDAVTDAETYPAGVSPQLSISLSNKGAVSCTLDVGSATQVFTVTSGEDVWWRSTDCQENPSNMVVTLEAGQTVTSAEPVVWDRTRSDVGTCDQENRARAPGGGASYHVAVSIGGFNSANSRQILLY